MKFKILFRNGKFIHVGESGFARILKTILAQQGKQQDAQIKLHDYVQVSEKNKPFGNELDVPEGVLLPFSASEDLTNDEIIEIVDFSRTSPKMIDPPNRISIGFDGTLPILSIKRLTDSIIQITSGSQEGPLSGYGHSLECAKMENGFVVLEASQWCN